MPQREFETYFNNRATRFARFYGSERVARVLGRGALFDRLSFAVAQAERLHAASVLDIGSGSGPLFAPLAEQGIRVTALEPAAAMAALARQEASRLPAGLVDVQERGWESLDEEDTHDLAVALGVFDYVDDASKLLSRMSRAAPAVVASFPRPGARTALRRLRYGMRGVDVHGYDERRIDALARDVGLRIAEKAALGRAGFAVLFDRAGTPSG